MSSLIAHANLGSFFRDEVSSATNTLGVKLNESTEYYVVNLLCEYSKPESTPMPGDEPLALLYKRALEAETADRIQLLKNLGDLSLYMSGFFAEFIEKSLVDLNYYMQMGGNAYTSLSGLVGGGTVAQIYHQLSNQFAALVDVLMQVSDRFRPNTDDELVRLYDRWMRTRSERVHRLLVDRGLVFSVQNPDEVFQ